MQVQKEFPAPGLKSQRDFHIEFDGEINLFMVKPDMVDFQKNLEFSKIGNNKSIPSSLAGLSQQVQNVTPPFQNNINEPHLSNNPNFQRATDYQPNIKVSNSNNTNDASKIQNDKPNQIVIINPDEDKKYPLLYTYWHSNNQICCRGYLMTGPRGDCKHNIFTWMMILGISISFFVLCAPYMWLKVHWIYVAVIAYLFLSTIAFLILTQVFSFFLFLFLYKFSDPGIVPKKEIFDLLEITDSIYLDPAVQILMFQIVQSLEQSCDNSRNEGTGGTPDQNGRPQRQKKFSKTTSKSKKRLCTTCKIVKQPRMSHCKDCGNCVEVFDHHCPFVNNCIGKRNYKYFIGFLISLLLLGIGELGGFLIIFIGNFGEGIDNGKSDIVVQNTTILIIILCVLGIPTVFFTLGVLVLACFHCCLVIKGKTTKERLGKQTQQTIQVDTAIPSVNWCTSDPSLVKLRQPIKIEQPNFYLKNGSGQII